MLGHGMMTSFLDRWYTRLALMNSEKAQALHSRRAPRFVPPKLIGTSLWEQTSLRAIIYIVSSQQHFRAFLSMGSKEIFNPLSELHKQVEVATASAFQVIRTFAQDRKWGMQYDEARAPVSCFVNEKGMWLMLPYREVCMAAGVAPQLTVVTNVPLFVDISTQAPFDKLTIDFGENSDGLPMKALIAWVDAVFEVSPVVGHVRIS